MAEYIEREDLLKVLPPKCNMGDMYATAYNTCLNIIENLIKEQPTADVVPVVRCKDCKHKETLTDSMNKKISTICLLGEALHFVEDNHYCSYGERIDKND
jgi:hypothetical protein